ncbi:hypothetical protein MPSI1_003928 [Malassezia psittaci]|uniref:Uncharacterized protein n=1 Tax=Malassezia psittaci TaxID=1821823 RepID=A0AAF0FEH2_9BASI|nr:hypothetical protein MPSI1_003928 [Malassezia psittaci]
MCIVLWTTQHPDYNNRDEFLARPASQAEWRNFNKDKRCDVLCGVDTLAGGTWFGVTRTGAIAVLTNFTEPTENRSASSDVRSRGELVMGFLKMYASEEADSDGIQAYLDRVSQEQNEYNGFNLLVGSTKTQQGTMLGYITNRCDDQFSGNLLRNARQEACNGVYGLSNSTLATPWPKIHRAKRLMQDVLQEKSDSDAILEGVFGMLQDTSGPIRTREDMQRTIHVEPFLLASQPNGVQVGACGSKHSSWYGTRTSTVLMISRHAPRRALFVERDVYGCIEPQNEHTQPTLLDFGLESVRANHERRYEWSL